MQFNCTLKPDGLLLIHNRKDMDQWLTTQSRDKDIPFLLTIEKKKKKRSNEVNRYWWGVIIPIIHRGMYDLGNELTKDEVHEFLKSNFNFTEMVNEQTGEVLRVPKSTSLLGGSEFWELIDRVAKFAAEYLGEVIPMPGEQSELNFNR